MSLSAHDTPATTGNTGDTPTNAISLAGISKRYGATQALDDVSFEIAAGSTHGLIGRNGAGKSTLVRIITGLEKPDRGTMHLFGAPAGAERPGAGLHAAVSCVYQRPPLFDNLSVAENMFINRQPTGSAGAISWSRMNALAEASLAAWDISIDPRAALADIPIDQRQMVQIARALDSGSRIILLDEPTVQLDGGATERLFAKLAELKARGVTFVLVSHFLKEIEQACDGATVLRDGRLLWSRRAERIAEADLVDAVLAGQEKKQIRLGRERTAQAIAPRLALSGISDTAGAFEDISLSLTPGEIAAIAGLGGSGKYEVGEAIVGLRAVRAGTIAVDGEVVAIRSVKDSLAAGIGYVPADRHAHGYVPDLSVAENMTMTMLDRVSTAGFFSPSLQRVIATRLIDDVALVPPDPTLPVKGLSGGNQQKVVLARALASAPSILVLVSPTAGVDIAAKNAIYDLIEKALARDVAVLLISDDVDELLISPRVWVMDHGRLVDELAEPDEARLVRAMERMDDQ